MQDCLLRSPGSATDSTHFFFIKANIFFVTQTFFRIAQTFFRIAQK